MNYKKEKIMNFVEYYDEININGEFSELTDLQGINSNKYFQECKSNKNDIDLNRYRICRNHTFAYNKATSRNGEKISIAYRKEGDCLISPSYITFRLIRKDLILPEYLMICFSKSKFDRYARFNSWGSATEFLNWDDFTNMEIDVPDIEEQKKLVKLYNTIKGRIKNLEEINEALQNLAFNYYKKVVSNIDKSFVLSDFADITMGTSPEGETINEESDGVVFYQGRTDFGFRYPENRCYTTDSKKMAQEGDILMSVRAPVGDINIANEKCSIGRGIAAIRSKDKYNSFLFYTMLELNQELSKFNSEGTIFGSINKDDIYNLKIAIPDKNELESFENKIKIVDSQIRVYEEEIKKLKEFINLIFNK